MDLEKVALIAQTITWAFEDQFFEKDKRRMFQLIFERYLNPVDPAGELEPYDAIIKLGRKSPDDFNKMVKELRDKGLIDG
jgi:hypothetical protein